MSGSLWSLATVLGPIVLLLAIGYALATRRNLSRREMQKQHDAVEDIYRGGEGGPGAPASSSSPKPEKDG